MTWWKTCTVAFGDWTKTNIYIRTEPERSFIITYTDRKRYKLFLSLIRSVFHFISMIYRPFRDARIDRCLYYWNLGNAYFPGTNVHDINQWRNYEQSSKGTDGCRARALRGPDDKFLGFGKKYTQLAQKLYEIRAASFIFISPGGLLEIV